MVYFEEVTMMVIVIVNCGIFEGTCEGSIKSPYLSMYYVSVGRKTELTDSVFHRGR